MPLTAAERQKRYKQKLKLDPGKYEHYKNKQRAHYHAKKRLVNDLTPQERYNARVIWKLRQQNLRRNRKNLNRVINITPPSSPTMMEPNVREPENIERINMEPENASGVAIPQPDRTQLHTETRKKRGRKQIRRDRSKLFQENLQLRREIEQLKKKSHRYKKRLQRIQKKDSKPKKSTKYEELSNAIKERYQNIKGHRDKNLLKDIFTNVDSSRREEMIQDSLGLTGKIRATFKVRTLATKLKLLITDFFLREEVSRATAGKKETVTKQGDKVQKRFLLDTQKNLHKTFLSENSGVKCSYYYFTRNKPFYILKPSVSGREMCLCKTHTNPSYKAKSLKTQGVIKTHDINQLIVATVCDAKVQACMYGTCDKCSHLSIRSESSEKNNNKIQWKEWGRVEETYEKDGKIMKTFKNVKLDKESTVKDLLAVFNAELKLLKKHVYNMKIQFKSFREAIDNLQQTEAVIVVDFSENYSCKHHEEIQAHHFGGSRQQVSLHTVVVYIMTDNNKKVKSYCTVSSNTNHQPAAIWAHMDPVLKDIRSSHPDITTIHFFSDGPFSQYRQKQNFYRSSTATFEHCFLAMSWSFFEAGHGKGLADGIGGYLKRSADELVARGEDISNCKQFYDVLKDISKIKLYEISSEDIAKTAEKIPPNIHPLSGTKYVHQIFTAVAGKLKYRNLSCFCNRSFCECLSPKNYEPLKPVTKNVKEKKQNKKKPNNLNESRFSSEDDEVLSSFRNSRQKSPFKEIDILELTKTHNKNWYDTVYPETSDDDEHTPSQPSSSANVTGKENRGVQRGDFLLVNVSSNKGKYFKYVCTVDELHDDGDIRVTFLRYVKNKSTFVLDKSDVADIDYTDIVKILDKPNITIRRGVQYYIFKQNVEVTK